MTWDDEIAIRDFLGNLNESMRQELLERFSTISTYLQKAEYLAYIGYTGDPLFSPFLISLLESDVAVEIKQAAATAAGKTGGKGVKDILLKNLESDSLHIRLGCIYGLASLRDKTTLPALLFLLDDWRNVDVWWLSPKAAPYIIAEEAAGAIDAITGEELKGNRRKILDWISKSGNE